MVNITIRDLPIPLHQWLKQQARDHHRSVNKEIISLLQSTRDESRGGGQHRASLKDLQDICYQCASLPVLDERSADEILNYDQNSGLG